MKKITTEKKKIEVEKITNIEYFCDRCKNEIKKESSFSRNEIVIQFKEGYVYPEGGSTEIEEAYLCENCGDVIKQLLIDNGVIFTKETKDY